MNRKEQLTSELKRVLRILSDERTVQSVIVFGSYVSGDISGFSDLDMVVIQDTDLNFWDRLKEMKKLLQPRVGMDVLVYTPDEYRKMRKSRPFVREEISKKGMTVYERKHEQVA